MSKPSGVVHRALHAQIVEQKDAEIARLAAELERVQAEAEDLRGRMFINPQGAAQVLRQTVDARDSEIAILSAQLAAETRSHEDTRGALALARSEHDAVSDRIGRVRAELKSVEDRWSADLAAIAAAVGSDDNRTAIIADIRAALEPL